MLLLGLCSAVRDTSCGKSPGKNAGGVASCGATGPGCLWCSFLFVNGGRDLPQYIKGASSFRREGAHVREVSPVPSRSRLAICTGVPRVVARYVRRVVVSVLSCSSWRRCRPHFALDGGAPLATRGLCATRGVWRSYQTKFEIGIVNCSLGKRSSLPHRELRTRGRLVGEPRYPSSASPRNLEQADLRRSKNMPASLVHTETKMNTHKHFEAGIELHSLSIIRYDRNINGMRPKSKESHFCPLNPPDADRLVHTSHTPPSSSRTAMIGTWFRVQRPRNGTSGFWGALSPKPGTDLSIILLSL